MSSAVPINSAMRTKTYASGDLVDADGVKTSFATSTSEAVLAGADLNGAAILAGNLGFISGFARSLTITRSNNAAQFAVTPIVVVGMYGGLRVTASVTPANANGNDTLRIDEAFDQILSITIPAQGGTGGTFTIGVQDICARRGERFVGVELAAAGTLNVRYGEGPTAPTDAIPVATAAVGMVKTIAPTRILTSAALSSPTSVGLTIYAQG